ncbi:MAG: M13 family metallopeptidase [Bacteroidetes bacterium]|uniref:M13 family metallopeptidase n=1 Tax=Candidatus Cryptobacteroides intestinigallinarum TaxID=2840767 RepID=A0A9D9MYY3_9BACT|nr:M13 family metallopeptidase [Candidatus Cryptobacteroides intestinigallinarum]
MKKLLLIMIPAFAVACNHVQEGTPAINPANFDTSVSPADNFYQYVTGGWQKNNPLKPEYSRYGSFDVLADNNQQRINDIFKSLGQQTAMPGSVEQKISDLYKMGLDSTRLNAEGAAPLMPFIEKIKAVKDRRGLVEAVADMHSASDYPFFNTYVSADLMDNANQILYIMQSGLGMGDRDYYVDTANAELKAGYKAYLEKIFSLSGYDDPAKAASDALAVEDALAAASWSSVELRDIPKMYNPLSTAELVKQYPDMDFSVYFRALGIDDQDKLIVGQPSYFKALDSLFASADIEMLKNYVAGQLISGACASLGDDYYAASFDFFQKQMAGVQQQKPRWKRAMAVPNNLLSEAVGKMYVAKYFSPEQKERVLKMVENIRTALGEHVDSLDWMSDSTKIKAHEKLNSFIVKIGYPDKWKDYSTLIINPSLSYYENIRNTSKWYVADNFSKLGKPVDKTEWQMSPQTVNAYYNPTTNEICFPAAILQPPFYNPEADDAVNYGGIGVVISHEMTHGFDDQGRNFDKDGNMVNWWTEADAEAFKAKTAVLVKQFDEVEVLPGLNANGALSLGENIADQGGLRIAYTAMENSFGGNRPDPIDGFTPEQRFYISYATLWAQNITDEEKARLTKLDVHSLGENRVNVTLRNLDTFFEAFGIKEGDPMYRPASERVVIW